MAKINAVHKGSKKQVIRERATHLFREKGYSATSMRHLADDIGVEAASLYNHIENKAALLKDICFEVAEAFTQQIEMAETNGGSCSSQVIAVIRFQIKMMLEQFEAVYVSSHDWKHLQEPWQTDFLQQRRAYEKHFSAIIEKGIRLDEFRQVNPYVAVVSILSAVRGIEFLQRSKRNIGAAEIEEDMVTLLINGLKK